MSIGLLFNGMYDAKAFIRLARDAEGLGAESAWIAEQPGYRDSAVIAADLLRETHRLSAFPGVISPYSRHPMSIAMSAGTLSELHPGRVGIVVGTGGVSNQETYGVRVEQPIQTLKETITALRALLRGETLHIDGQRFTFHGARLGVEAQPAPIFMAAIGPRMQATAGAYADGVVFSAGHSPKFIGQSVERVRRAHQASPRTSEPFTYVGFVIASVSHDHGEAYQASKALLSYLFSSPYKAADWALNDVEVDHEAIQEARERGDSEAARALIGDDLVEIFTASGTPGPFQRRIRTYLQAGLDRLVLSPLGDQEAQLRAIRLAVQASDP
jgi:5,10-methylenetetrahydromethanopterin reductase